MPAAPSRKPRRAAPATRRCKYVSPRGERCSRIATIDGELCSRCADLLEDEISASSLIDDLATGRVSIGDVISGAVSSLFQQWAGGSEAWQTIDEVARQAAQRARRTAPRPRAGSPPGSPGSRSSQRPPPRSPPDVELAKRLRAARITLGLSATGPLNERAIGERRKALARIYHPDRPGGSTAQMQKINEAADLLIAHLAAAG